MKRFRISIVVLLSVMMFATACFVGQDGKETVANTSPVANGVFVGEGIDMYGLPFAIWKSRFTYYVKFPTPQGFAVDPFLSRDPSENQIVVRVFDCYPVAGSEIIIKGFALPYSVDADEDGTSETVVVDSTVVMTNIDAARLAFSDAASKQVFVPEGLESHDAFREYAVCLGAVSTVPGMPPFP